jgi:hypothetical protein
MRIEMREPNAAARRRGFVRELVFRDVSYFPGEAAEDQQISAIMPSVRPGFGGLESAGGPDEPRMVMKLTADDVHALTEYFARPAVTLEAAADPFNSALTRLIAGNMSTRDERRVLVLVQAFATIAGGLLANDVGVADASVMARKMAFEFLEEFDIKNF